MPTFFHSSRAPHWPIELLFWGLLAWVTWAMIAPIWVGPMPPMTDFGGHVAMADVWARFDEVALYREVFELRGGLIPNTLSARFAGWLHPLMGTLAATRLFVSLTMLATVAALLGALRSFERSRWLVFVGMPFLWNGSFFWGMINFLPTLPLFFAAIALARQLGLRGGWRRGVALALIGLVSFFAHGLGCVFVLGAAGFVLLFSLTNWRRLGHAVALLPATSLWLFWRSATSGGSGLPRESLLATLRRDTRWWEADKAFKEVARYALDVTASQQDTVFAVSFLFIWLLLIGLSQRVIERSDARAATPVRPQVDIANDAHESSRVATLFAQIKNALSGANLQRYLRAAYAEARENCVLLLAIALGMALLFFPAYILNTNIKTRVMPFFIFTLILLPRLPRRSLLASVALGAAVVGGLMWGHYLTEHAHQFARQEMAPIVKLSAHIPEQSRVECLQTRPMPPPVFWFYPLDLNCPALIQLRTDSFGGFGFPSTAFNPVRFRKGQGYVSLRGHGFGNLKRLRKWDYIVVRGKHRRPKASVAERVATAKAELPDAPAWTLYRVIQPADKSPSDPEKEDE